MSRVNALRNLLDSLELDAILVTSPTGVFYLTGFLTTTYSRPVLTMFVSDDEPKLLIPSIERSIAERLNWSGTISGYPGDGTRAIGEACTDLQKRGVQRVGFEPDSVSTSMMQAMQSKLPSVQFVDISTPLEPLWWIKTDEEIANIRRAGRLCLEGLKAAQLAVEGSEAELTAKARGDGATLKAAVAQFPDSRIQLFSNIIAGLRTAAGGGHDLPTGCVPKQGEPIFLVWAVACNGLWALMSRTTYIGSPPSNMSRLHERVEGAKSAALKRVHPGTQASAIYAAAVKALGSVAEQPGMVVSIGRGIGAKLWEAPMVDASNDTQLQPGMVLRIGPEVFHSTGAVGVIDTVLVTPEGCEVLTLDGLMA